MHGAGDEAASPAGVLQLHRDDIETDHFLFTQHFLYRVHADVAVRNRMTLTDAPLCRNNLPIGSTDLECVDGGMGVAYGRFHPEESYEAIRPQVIRAAEARHRNESGAALPQLELLTSTGEIVRTTMIFIDDLSDVEVDLEITVFLEDREQFCRLRSGLTSHCS